MNKEKISYKHILNNKNYTRLLIATTISRFGDSLDVIAYSFMIFHLTGSSSLMAILFAVNSLPSLIFSVFSGVVVSYLPKKKVIFVADISRGIFVFLTALLILFDNLEIWHLFMFTVLNSTFESFRAPAVVSLNQAILEKDMYVHAMSFSSSLFTGAEIMGYASASALISLISIEGVIIIDSLTFILCGMIILFLRTDKDVFLKAPKNIREYYSDLFTGIVFFKNEKTVLYVCLIGVILSFFTAPFNSLQAPYSMEVLGQGAKAMTIMSISFLIAMTISSFLSPSIQENLEIKYLMIMGGILFGLGYFLLSLLGQISNSIFQLISLSISSGIMGFSVPLIQIPIRIIMLKNVPNEFMSRVSSIFKTFMLASMPLGASSVALILKIASIELVFAICGILLILFFLVQIFHKS